MEQTEYTLKEFFSIVIRRWRVLLVILVITFIAAFLFTLMSPDIYTGRAVLVVVKSKLGEKVLSYEYMGLELDTFTHMLLNRQTLVRILVDLKKYKNENPDSKIPENMTLKDLEKRVSVAQLRNTDLVAVEVKLEEPVLARDIANKLAESAVEINKKILSVESSDSSTLWDEQLGKAKVQFDLVDNDFTEFSKEAHLRELEGEVKSLIAVLTDLEFDEAGTRNDVATYEGKLLAIEERIKDESRTVSLHHSVSENKDVLNFAKRFLSEEDKEALSLGVISEFVNEVRVELEIARFETFSELEGYRKRLATIQEQMKDVREKLRATEKEFNEGYMREKRYLVEYSTAQDSYMVIKTADTRLQSVIASERQELMVFDPAVVPEKPSGPFRLAISLILSLVCTTLTFTVFVIRDILKII